MDILKQILLKEHNEAKNMLPYIVFNTSFYDTIVAQFNSKYKQDNLERRIKLCESAFNELFKDKKPEHIISVLTFMLLRQVEADCDKNLLKVIADINKGRFKMPIQDEGAEVQ